jgi:hypothetical protein
MKLFVNFFDNLINRPSNKFSMNLFFLKNSLYFNLKNINYIHIFINLKKFFSIKIFKFNYTIYNHFLIYFTIINIILQLIVIVVIL